VQLYSSGISRPLIDSLLLNRIEFSTFYFVHPISFISSFFYFRHCEFIVIRIYTQDPARSIVADIADSRCANMNIRSGVMLPPIEVLQNPLESTFVGIGTLGVVDGILHSVAFVGVRITPASASFAFPPNPANKTA